ncbi:unnamed protein product [Scytosiphon promiscuus]
MRNQLFVPSLFSSACSCFAQFWGFANDIVSVSEAKRFYPLFGLGANVALVFSGQYVR